MLNTYQNIQNLIAENPTADNDYVQTFIQHIDDIIDQEKVLDENKTQVHNKINFLI